MKLSRYDILDRLGQGGMSEIFLALQRGIGGFSRLVALKRILPEIRAQQEFVTLFLDEAKTIASFTHQGIAQIYDLDGEGEDLFLAMEFVPGANLEELSTNRIPLGVGLAVARDTAL